MKQTQSKQILEYLTTHNSITPLEALNLFGCFRLGARIWDLKREGYNIKMELENNGDKHYAKYSLILSREMAVYKINEEILSRF